MVKKKKKRKKCRTVEITLGRFLDDATYSFEIEGGVMMARLQGNASLTSPVVGAIRGAPGSCALTENLASLEGEEGGELGGDGEGLADRPEL